MPASPYYNSDGSADIVFVPLGAMGGIRRPGKGFQMVCRRKSNASKRVKGARPVYLLGTQSSVEIWARRSRAEALTTTKTEYGVEDYNDSDESILKRAISTEVHWAGEGSKVGVVAMFGQILYEQGKRLIGLVG